MAITTQLPYVARKRRKPETARYVVKWIVADTMYFQWFKRDSAAVAFLNRLVNDGIQARVLIGLRTGEVRRTR